MDKKRRTERDGQPAFGLPPGEGFKHFLQHYSYQTKGPDINNPMIEVMNSNPNCYNIENPSKLDLTKKEEEFIKHNLGTLLPLVDKVRKPKKGTPPKKERFHATHLEMRGLNTIWGGIEWK